MHAFRFGSRLALAALFLGSSLASAQAPSPAPAAAPPAPVPPAILTAKKLFLANDGADAGLFPHPFSGSTSRGYDEFYAALRAMGRYELVSSPSQADLVLEFRLLAPLGPTNGDKSNGAPDPLPAVRVRIYDAQSHFVLWAFSEEVEGALTQQPHDRKFDEAIARLAKDFQNLTVPSPAAPQP